MKILLVDDHRDTLRAFSRLLESHGYHVRCADSVDAVRQSTACASFDLLLTDLGLPDGDILDLVPDLLATQRVRTVIAVTGSDMAPDQARSKAAGCAEHLVKPVKFDEVVHLIERLARPGLLSQNDWGGTWMSPNSPRS